ncbi:MAG: twin-arginine translocase subunit TatC [Halobacteriota archaeon]
MVNINEELGYIIVAIKRRSMLVAAVFIAGFCISFPFLDRLILKIKGDLLPEGVKFIAISPLEVVLLKIKLSMVVGVILATPLICYYVYKTLNLRLGISNPVKISRMIIILNSAILLFILGLSYSYFLMLPLILKILYADALSAGVISMYSIHDFMLFIIIMTLILGITFEVPLTIIAAVHSGIIQLQTLKEYRRYVYVALVAIAAVVTPTTDAVSLLMVAVPLIICYEFGILGASISSNRQSRAA